ncbi:SMP-30/gluconolactonase/LRE family protein [Larkinella insperata]|uniref:SMP-30/gluconolactonase/LRE family protein n=1 Tax=Larkinella insperata TaxID=332158 RepID=A0ABW3QD58_9BACT|nr:L-dopachrome tautomerase-related protein [Larkinella insperata]
MKKNNVFTTVLGLVLTVLGGCDNKEDDVVPGITLTEVATSSVQWTGVAVSQQSKLFANYPRMEVDTIPYSVAVLDGGQALPFPNQEWNTWNPTLNPQDHFICVQSVYVDDQNNLWVLDPASPQMRGVVKGGAKLLKFNPNTGELLQRIVFNDEMVVYPSSYLNDVRVDTQKNLAYITDSNQGGIIVVNLTSGQARRLLGRHPSTKSEGTIITAEGRIYRTQSGKIPSSDSDGIALNPQRTHLYWHALTGRSLYRVPTEALQNESLTDEQVAAQVEKVADTEPTDGMIFDPNGNLYLSAMQLNAVIRMAPDGRQERMVQSEQLKWPDTFALGPDGQLYVTTSQLHIPRTERTEPYRIFKFNLQ